MISISKFYFLVTTILLLSGCSTIISELPILLMNTEDPNKKPNLAKSPIGLHVEKICSPTGVTNADITVKNNSGSFIPKLNIEVLVFNGTTQVGKTNEIYESLKAGKSKHTQRLMNINYPCKDLIFTYKIHK